MRILFSAGEASGDLYAASIATELLNLDPSLRIGGIGGTRFSQIANEPLIADSSNWGAMSVIKSIRKGFSILPYYRAIKRAFHVGEPGIFVPIDFGFMNLKLCRAAKEAGWKVVYFVPPGSWRRDRQGADIPVLTDAVVTPFPWSYEILKQMGANVYFFGHPLKQIHKVLIETPFERKGLAVLPGSRESELEQLVPTLRETVKDYPGKIQLPVPKTFIPYLEKNWTRNQDDVLNGAETGTVMRALRTSEAGIVCSGTATLEAALSNTPTVVVYKVSDIVIMELWLIRFKRPQFASQPNILLQRDVVPELLQENFTVEKLKRTLDEIQTDAVAQRQRSAFAEISELLGGDDCITKTAELILSL